MPDTTEALIAEATHAIGATEAAGLAGWDYLDAARTTAAAVRTGEVSDG